VKRTHKKQENLSNSDSSVFEASPAYFIRSTRFRKISFHDVDIFIFFSDSFDVFLFTTPGFGYFYAHFCFYAKNYGSVANFNMQMVLTLWVLEVGT